MKSTKSPSWIERLLGFAPVPSPPHVFLLDEHRLRYASFERGPEGLAFAVDHWVDFEPGAFVAGPLGGPLRERGDLVRRIAALLEKLPETPKEATLLLPDAWLRLSFTEAEELPRSAAARAEVLAWKAKRLVPFRVEDLRLSAIEVAPFPDQEQPIRLMLGFAVEALVGQLEEVFREAGVVLGRITNRSLATAASVDHQLDDGELAAMVTVEPQSYTILFFRDGDPLLYRYKATLDPSRSAPRDAAEEIARLEVLSSESATGSALRPDAVIRDLRLTAGFVEEHFPDTALHRVFLAAPPDEQLRWGEWIRSEWSVTPEVLQLDHFELTRARPQIAAHDIAPLLGAASLRVA